MATANEQQWKYNYLGSGQTFKLIQRAERDLQVHLGEENLASYDTVAHLLASYRSICQDFILQDFELATKKGVENRLWDFHGKINNRFRKQIRYFQEADGKRKPVEYRKTAKQFLDFIKSGQRFYRQYIQNVASRFEGVKELDAVADRLTLSTLAIDSPCQISGELRQSVLVSCHQTLVRLGDLSRWRETQLVTKNRNWGPAIGYYDLAGRIYPSSGASHNQLAVIALVDANHLRATYHLFRALAVEEPHPGAKGNLEIEFKKIEEIWSKGDLIVGETVKDTHATGKFLVVWFMRLHARCYKGVDFPEHEELEGEVMSQLSLNLKERSLDSTFSKVILINIAAEYFAGVRLRDNPGSSEALQSFFFLQRLNVRTFFTLLQVLQPELERFTVEHGSTANGTSTSVPERMTVVTRRVLPGLRQYSSWLVSNASILAAKVGDRTLKFLVRELWKVYANDLTLLASTFPVSELKSVEYLLEEDEDTLGFKPFDNEHTRRRYYCDDMFSPKPRFYDQGTQRYHPNMEMLGRVRDLLTDGMILQSQPKIPICFVKHTTSFTFVEEGMQGEEAYQPTLLSTEIERRDVTHVDETVLISETSQAALASATMDLDAKRMVDDLVGSETTSQMDEDTGKLANGVNTSGAHIQSSHHSSGRALGNETSYGLISSSTAREHFEGIQNQHPVSPRPLLPSIYNSPFAPQPGEETPGSRPGTANRKTPSHSHRGSQSTFPLQQQPDAIHVPSSLTSMPDPTNPRPLAGGALQVTSSYALERGNAIQAALDDSNFMSSGIFAGSTWGASGQSVRIPSSVHTPPNGQVGG